MSINDDDSVISNPDGSIASADGSIVSMGGSITSSYADVILLTNPIKLPAIFFASAYGTTIPLPKARMLSYAEIISVHRRLFSTYGDIILMDRSLVSS
ncbi:hypothetical protein [Sphingobacterium corticibacterium]|uniref:Uncharacterized protein n=1 Tax=Sphingobacterium corticibacterium TaxID=2484746 RepID=A0A4Q6XNJ0_9SPHI|nr:hypothetical protein [Sphingobacterium corticibacterium]RZF61481.1 hypothetical protein EWE74_01155 [Sphingobacterium corticibacterium]